MAKKKRKEGRSKTSSVSKKQKELLGAWKRAKQIKAPKTVRYKRGSVFEQSSGKDSAGFMLAGKKTYHRGGEMIEPRTVYVRTSRNDEKRLVPKIIQGIKNKLSERKTIRHERGHIYSFDKKMDIDNMVSDNAAIEYLIKKKYKDATPEEIKDMYPAKGELQKEYAAEKYAGRTVRGDEIREARKALVKEVKSNVERKTLRKIQQIETSKAQFRKILVKGPRPVLDLRRRGEREVPVKQHGFKEGDISHATILSQ